MILDTIVEQKRLEVAELKARGFEQVGEKVEAPRGFKQALVDFPGVALIAEAKKASPSKGIIRPDFDPALIARGYEDGGVQAMSVLTDVNFFQGDLSYIRQVRQEVKLPVLRKDFIIDEIQIQEARLAGADAILLIAAILDKAQIVDFLAAADQLGMDSLVEVHDEAELEKALAAGSSLVGINNRNLNDFSMDLNTTFRLKKEIPDDIPVVSESGIRDNDDIRRCADAGISAVLVGETLMRSGNLADAVRELMGR